MEVVIILLWTPFEVVGKHKEFFGFSDKKKIWGENGSDTQ